MGHDISSFNKAGQEIGYVRFTMGDVNAPLFYNLFDANEYFAGVSGSGEVAALSLVQIEKALTAFTKWGNNFFGDQGNHEFLLWQQNEIQKFINGCLETARNEGEVRVFFG